MLRATGKRRRLATRPQRDRRNEEQGTVGNLLQMLFARRMQRGRGNVAMGGTAAASGCGCVSMVVTLVVVGASSFGAWKIYDSSMDVVDESFDAADEQIDEMFEEFQSGDISGIDHEGSYECEGDS